MSKKIIIIAGPNGAGKTTFARSFLPEEAQCPRFINADLIAAGLSPFAPETAAIRAGRLMLEEVAACVHRGDSFAFETTLSGLSYLRHIKQWRAQGYHVSLYFLTLPNADTAIARVAGRVRQGGHDIPETVIRRRFAAGRRNFEQYYKARVNTWVEYDNAGEASGIVGMGREHMKAEDIAKATNPDLRASLAAMQRAARLARKIAIQTETEIVMVRNGKLVHLSAEELRQSAEWNATKP